MNSCTKNNSSLCSARGAALLEYVLAFGILIVTAVGVAAFLNDTFRKRADEMESSQVGLAPCRRGANSLIQQQLDKGLDAEACL